MKNKIYTLLLLAIIGSALYAQGPSQGASDVMPVAAFEDLYRFGNFYISAQPEVTRLTWLKDHGVKTIINLRSEEENETFVDEEYDEKFVAEKLGFDYYSLPVDGNAGFNPSNQAAFNDLADAETPTLVHCQSGRRATFFFIVYLVQEQGYSLQEAVNTGRQMKYSSPLEQLMDAEFIMEINPD